MSILWLTIIVAGPALHAAPPSEQDLLTGLAGRLEFLGVAVHEPGYHVWGSSPIVDDAGRVHLFVARWPIDAGFDPGWRTHSEIAHYVGEAPEGPFEFVDVALRGTGDDTWDAFGAHNPQILRVGARYALLYIGNDGIDRHPANQCIGMAVADSLAGPWTRVGDDGRILAPSADPGIWTHRAANGVNNPALLPQPDGRFLLYFKSSGGKLGLAGAERLEGPYRQHPGPVTTNDRAIEDGTVFRHDGRVCLITTDNHGILERGGGLLWTSADGVSFEPPRVAFHLFSSYLTAQRLAGQKRIYGREVKLERPQILIQNGIPTHLYGPSGVNIDGRAGTDSYVFRLRSPRSRVATGAPREPRSPPNIVLILADDLGYGDLRCYDPASKIPTPRIDALAAAGLRFLDAHSPSSVCSPTRYALLTGRYAWRTGLARSVLWPWDPPLLEAPRTTLPELLGEAGYTTACIGKWHLGWRWADADGDVINRGWPVNTTPSARRREAAARVDYSRRILDGPTSHGFDHYFGDDVPNFPPYVFIRDDRVIGEPVVAKPASMFGHAGAMLPGWDLRAVLPELGRRATDYLADRAEDGEPFFLYLALTAPHTPIAPLARFGGRSAAGAYGDFVAEVDDVVGGVLAALDTHGLAGNTLVIFTSDNGSPARNGRAMSGPPASVTRDHGHRPNGPWRGLKSDAWEAGHRVPFIVRWPGRVEAGRTRAALLCHTDIYATVASILGRPLPQDAAEDSIDFLPLLGGAARGVTRTSVVHHSGNGTFAIRSGRWKLIPGNLGSGGFSAPARVVPKAGDPGGQLYDLDADPGETDNRWSHEPALVRELEDLLEEIRSRGRSRP